MNSRLFDSQRSVRANVPAALGAPAAWVLWMLVGGLCAALALVARELLKAGVKP